MSLTVATKFASAMNEVNSIHASIYQQTALKISAIQFFMLCFR